jgi:hypothetical protein
VRLLLEKVSFLHAFAKSQKVTCCFVMSACLYVGMEQLSFYWTDFHEIWYLNVFFKHLSKNLCCFKIIQEQQAIYVKTNICFQYLTQFFLEWKTFQKKVVENIKTHISCSITSLKNCAIYEIMWKNIVEWGRPQMTIQQMYITCCILRATNTHTDCVIVIAFPLQQ